MPTPSGGRAAGAQESEGGELRGREGVVRKRLEGCTGPQRYEWGDHVIHPPKGTLENDAAQTLWGFNAME